MTSSEFPRYEDLAGDQMLLCCMCRKLLDNPVLLECLHNCCQQCLDASPAGEACRSVTCPACSHTTNIASASANALIGALVKQFKASVDARVCTLCSYSSNDILAAAVWCKPCGKSFCVDCMTWHNTFNKDHSVVSVEEISSWSDAIPMPVLTCSQHGRPYDFMCLTCLETKCVGCLSACIKLRHDMVRINDDSVPARVAELKQELTGLEKDLLIKARLLGKRMSLPAELISARAVHLEQLRTNKIVVLDAVGKAFAAAEDALINIYDALEVKAYELMVASAQLNKEVQHALAYVRYVLGSTSACGLLHQQKQLLKQLTSLVKGLETLQEPLDAASIVEINSIIPDDLQHLISTWVGVPRVLTDDLCHGSADLERSNGAAAASASAYVQQRGTDQPTARHATSDPPRFGAAYCRFTLAVECFDVAVTSEANLLLAAYHEGLREFDVSGRELSSWRPVSRRPADGISGAGGAVSAVDSLNDGRAAVGVVDACYIAVLRRRRSDVAGGSAWLEEQQITGLVSPPMQLSIYDDLVAVSEYNSNGKLGAAQFVLLRLSSGDQVARQTLDYNIQSVACTGDAVVTVSKGKVRVRSNKRAHVVDCYSHTGQLIWRHLCGCQVWDICSAASGRVLYVAVHDSQSMRAIGTDNGRWLKDAANKSSGSKLQAPVRLSVGRGENAFMAMLSDDLKTVAVYRGTTQ